jgi:hypothetical protein
MRPLHRAQSVLTAAGPRFQPAGDQLAAGMRPSLEDATANRSHHSRGEKTTPERLRIRPPSGKNMTRSGPARLGKRSTQTRVQLGSKTAQTPVKRGSGRYQKARRVNHIAFRLICKTSIPGSNPGGASNHKSLKHRDLRSECFWSNFCRRCVLARSFGVEVQKTPPRISTHAQVPRVNDHPNLAQCQATNSPAVHRLISFCWLSSRGAGDGVASTICVAMFLRAASPASRKTSLSPSRRRPHQPANRRHVSKDRVIGTGQTFST